jgi:hypothetical protein
MNWQTFLSTLLGALVSFSAVLLTYSLDRRKRRHADEKARRALLNGLYDELNGFFAFARPDPSDELAGRMHEAGFAMTQDYFTLYHANVGQVMQLENAELRHLIVKTYTQGKVLVGMTRINQQCFERMQYLESTFHKTKDPTVEAAVERYRQIKAYLLVETKAADSRFNVSARQLLDLLTSAANQRA